MPSLVGSEMCIRDSPWIYKEYKKVISVWKILGSGPGLKEGREKPYISYKDQ